MTEEKKAISNFLKEQIELLKKERKQFDAEGMKHKADALHQELTGLDTDPATAHQYVEDALRYMAFLLADSALHPEANTAGYELNVHLKECHRLLGHTQRHWRQTILGWITGFTHRPWRIAWATALVCLCFAVLHGVITMVTGQPAIVYQSLHDTRVPWWGYLYFSVVTLATLGYGDICPNPQHPLAACISILACVEAVLGYLALGLFIGFVMKSSGTHPYARIGRWIQEYEEAMLPTEMLQTLRHRLYHPDWPGYTSKS